MTKWIYTFTKKVFFKVLLWSVDTVNTIVNDKNCWTGIWQVNNIIALFVSLENIKVRYQRLLRI